MIHFHSSAVVPDKKKNVITGVPFAVEKTYGDKAFQLKASAKGKITYRSSDKNVIKVNAATGRVTVAGCGTAVITVTAAGNDAYRSASAKIKVTVKPKKQTISSLKSKKKKTLTVKWKKDAKVSGYELQYSADRKFKKSVKRIWIKKNKTTVHTIKNLKGGKKYYVRIRGYKTVKENKIYGKWSKPKTLKIKK